MLFIMTLISYMKEKLVVLDNKGSDYSEGYLYEGQNVKGHSERWELFFLHCVQNLFCNQQLYLSFSKIRFI